MLRSGEADGDPAATGGSAEGSDLYQTEEGKNISLLLPVRQHDVDDVVLGHHSFQLIKMLRDVDTHTDNKNI